MGRGMSCPGYHAVGHILVHHHGTKITDITQCVRGHVYGDAFVFAQFNKSLDKLFMQ